MTLRYRFVHVLYQNALYATLQPTRRASWSAAVAQSLVGYYGEKSTVLAAELALLWEAARDFPRAVDCFLLAAQNAVRVFANHEAVKLARRGLKLLEAFDPVEADEKRDGSEDAEAAVDEPPEGRDTADWASDEGEGNGHEDTRRTLMPVSA